MVIRNYNFFEQEHALSSPSKLANYNNTSYEITTKGFVAITATDDTKINCFVAANNYYNETSYSINHGGQKEEKSFPRVVISCWLQWALTTAIYT